MEVNEMDWEKNIDDFVAPIVYDVKAIFDPIARRFGMKDLPIEKTIHTEYSFAYLMDKLGVEIDIELTNFCIFLLIFKPKNGKIPIGYEDEFGNRHAVYIETALEKIGIDFSQDDEKLKKMVGDYLKWREMANILARLWEDNWEVIAANAELIFQKRNSDKHVERVGEVRMKLEEVWREKRYKDFVELCELIKEDLTPVEMKKLEYARKHLR